MREHAESVLKSEREIWGREKMESQQALRAAQVELSRLREELNKEAATRIPVSSHESDTDEITWPRAKVGLPCNVVELETSRRKYCLLCCIVISSITVDLVRGMSCSKETLWV